MPSLRDKHTSAGLRGLTAAGLATLVLVAIASSAMAGQDQLKGGSVVLQLQGSRGLKLKPATLNLPITGGAVDPIDGSGTVQVSGGFKAKRGKHKTKVTITSFTFGANGGPGNIAVKVGKKRKVGSFGTLAGGAVTRDGWGAKIANVSASLAGKGAKALNRAFSGRKHKGAKKSGGGKVKAGQPLGTIVSVTTVPLAVEVVPGTGTMTLNTNAMGAFVSKLPAHCIDPSPIGSPAGVSPVAPATANLLGTTYKFPVSGGSAAPDFSAGEVITGGGQTITKNHSSNPLNPNACDSADPPVGTKLVSTDIGVNFAQNSLNSTAALPTGASLRAPLGNIDFSTGTRSIDPNTKKLTVTGASVTLSFPAALSLNQFFPTESGNASDDFVAGDAIGTIDLTGVKLR
jgi:hypothetical protein